MKYRVNLAGCSGIGKTTMARTLSDILEVPFVSGSYSDLIPETKNIPHSDMIQLDAKTIFEQDVQLLNLRKKLFMENDSFVSDRSYLDSAAYMVQKLSHRLPTCDIEDFIEKCKALTISQCDKVIYLPYTNKHFRFWEIEDNGKRVLNKFYQAEITAIIDWILNYHWECKIIDFIKGNPILSLNGSLGFTAILVLNEVDFENRLNIVKKFLKE